MFYNYNFDYKINGAEGTRWIQYGFCNLTQTYVVMVGWYTKTDSGIDINKEYQTESEDYKKQIALANKFYNDKFNHLNELGCILAINQ